MIHIQSNYTNVKKVSNVRYIDYILNIDTDEEIQSSSNINIIFTTNTNEQIKYKLIEAISKTKFKFKKVENTNPKFPDEYISNETITQIPLKSVQVKENDNIIYSISFDVLSVFSYFYTSDYQITKDSYIFTFDLIPNSVSNFHSNKVIIKLDENEYELKSEGNSNFDFIKKFNNDKIVIKNNKITIEKKYLESFKQFKITFYKTDNTPDYELTLEPIPVFKINSTYKDNKVNFIFQDIEKANEIKIEYDDQVILYDHNLTKKSGNIDFPENFQKVSNSAYISVLDDNLPEFFKPKVSILATNNKWYSETFNYHIIKFKKPTIAWTTNFTDSKISFENLKYAKKITLDYVDYNEVICKVDFTKGETDFEKLDKTSNVYIPDHFIDVINLENTNFKHGTEVLITLIDTKNEIITDKFTIKHVIPENDPLNPGGTWDPSKPRPSIPRPGNLPDIKPGLNPKSGYGPDTNTLTLRVNNANLTPIVKRLYETSKNIRAFTKYDTLSYSEMDFNFEAIMYYLVDVKSAIDELRNVTGIGTDKIVKESELNVVSEKVQNLINSFNSFENNLLLYKNSLVEKFNEINTELNKKLENVKHVNSVDITGTGNATINISERQFKEHMTNIGFLEVGSYAILESHGNISTNQSYKGSDLYFDGVNTTQGTWRCMGLLENNKGLFLRII